MGSIKEPERNMIRYLGWPFSFKRVLHEWTWDFMLHLHFACRLQIISLKKYHLEMMIWSLSTHCESCVGWTVQLVVSNWMTSGKLRSYAQRWSNGTKSLQWVHLSVMCCGFMNLFLLFFSAIQLNFWVDLSCKTIVNQVLDIEFSNVKALYRRAQAYIGTADLHLAELDIKKALETDPQNRCAYSWIAHGQFGHSFH